MMKRPLAVVGLSYFTALAVAFVFSFIHPLVFSGIFLFGGILGLIYWLVRKRKALIPVVLITGAAACLNLFIFTAAYVTPVGVLEGKTVTVKGTVCDLPYERDGAIYYKLNTTEIDYPGAPQNTTILVSSSKALRADVYDSIKTKVRFRNTVISSDISKKVFIRGSLYPYSGISISHNENKPFMYHVIKLREKVLKTIDLTLPEKEADFASAVLAGDKYGLSSETNESMRTAGISHIICVSGFHLSVIACLVLFLLKTVLFGRERLASVLCALFVFIYMALTGFTIPVMRAGIMLILVLAGNASFRRADPLNSLGIAALLICFMDPYSAVDVSFLLSFGSTLGIILWSRELEGYLLEKLFPDDNKAGKGNIHKLRRYLRPAVTPVVSALSVTLCALTFTYPVILIFFRSFSPYAVLSNLLVTLAASVLIVSGTIMVILKITVVLSPLSVIFTLITAVLSDFIINVSYFVSSLPYAGMKSPAEFIPVCIVITAVFAIIIKLLKGISRPKKIASLLLIILVVFSCGNIADRITKKDSLKVTVFDVGEGLTVLLDKNGDRSLMFCSGSYDKLYSVNNYIGNSGDSVISYMLLPDTGCNYAESFLKRFDVDVLHIYDEDKYSARMHNIVMDKENRILSSSDDDSIFTTRWNDSEILVYCNGETRAVRVLSGQNKILIADKNTDCASLPEGWLENCIFIYAGSIKNPDRIIAEKIICSSQEASSDDKTMTTADSGDIGIRIYKDNSVSIRRESTWQS